jgi:hypothetical protein
MAKYHLGRRLIILAIAVALPLAVVGTDIPSAAASAPGASATSAAALGSQRSDKVEVPADDAPCVTPGAICAPHGEFSLTYTVTGSGDCSWTANIVWGDGTTDAVSYGSAGFTEEHKYVQPGLYDVSVTGSGTSADPATTCTFVPDNAEVEVPLSCADTYQTVVTEHAGLITLPELYTDTVTFSWCTDGNGHVQILSSSQAPVVQQTGFSISGAQIKLLKTAGFTFSVTPATAPVPTIDNEFTDASTTASGLSFNGQFDLGGDLADLLKGFIVAELAAPLVPLVRSGQLGLLSIKALHEWGTIVAMFDSFAARHFGLPIGLANWLANYPIGKIRDTVAGLAGQFAAALTQSLIALGHNATLTSVSNAIQSVTQQIASALIFTTVQWAPQITVAVDGSLSPPSVAPGDTKTALGISVEDPITTTTPTN